MWIKNNSVRLLVSFISLIFVVFTDQVTKYLFFVPQTSTLNMGISFGWGRHFSQDIFNLLIISSMILIVLCLFYFWWRGRVSVIVFILIAGGGISNLMDRIFLGGVRDFLFLGPWRNNLADYAICLGLFILIMQTSFDKRQKSNKIA